MSVSYFFKSDENRLAYVRIAASENNYSSPAVMFLGGFKSDMMGTKAMYLQDKCVASGCEFVRFDYSGHGLSDGEFVDGTIGSWKMDAQYILDNVVTSKEVVLVGSSMGGWISLRLLIDNPSRIKGVIGIAAGPDFTKDIENKMGQGEVEMLERLGRLEVPNDYGDDPYIFTQRLLEDGREQSVLHGEYDISCPLTIIQGKLDADVPWEKALKIKECFKGRETKVHLIDDGDHRLSRDEDLEIIYNAIKEMV